MELILAHKAEVFGILWLLSEILGSIESVKANGVFQLLKGLLGKLLGK